MKKEAIMVSLVLVIFSLGFVNAGPHEDYPSFAAAEFNINNNQLTISDKLIYQTVYYSINGNAWQNFTLSGNQYENYPFLLDYGDSNLPPALNETGTHFVIVFSCSLTNNNQAWDCHGDNGGAKWQLEVITNQNTNPDPNTGPLNLGPEPIGYLTLAEIHELVKDWSAAEPDMISYEVYGEAGGYELLAMRISAVDSYAEQNTPKALIHSCIHGDEVIATAASLLAFHRLLSDYGLDDRVTDLFTDRVVYYVPVMNPVGYENNQRGEEGRDTNRAFPYPGNPNNPPTSSTAALISFYEQKEFNAVTSVHADGHVIFTPWDYTLETFDDGGAGDAHRTVAQNMANAVGWSSAPGAQAYGHTLLGTGDDYFYIRGKELGYDTLSLCIEAGRSYRPPVSDISEEADDMVDLLTIFIEEAPIALSNN